MMEGGVTRWVGLLGGLGLVLGCAGLDGVDAPDPGPETTTVSLDMERLKRPDAPSGLPLVRARIGERELLMVVDLGAGATVIGAKLAAELGLHSENKVGAGGTGGTVTTATRHDDVSLSLLDLGAFESSVYSIPLPASLSDRGIEGILSPQQLLSGHDSFVLDLQKAELSHVQAVLGESSTSGMAAGERCSASEGQNVHYYLAADVAGESVRLLVDSGATRGSLYGTPERIERLKDAIGETAEVSGAGGVVEVQRLKPLSLRSGTVASDLVFDLEAPGQEPGCPSDGSVGMDLLHRCVVHLDHTRLDVSCPDLSAP